MLKSAMLESSWMQLARILARFGLLFAFTLPFYQTAGSPAATSPVSVACASALAVCRALPAASTPGGSTACAFVLAPCVGNGYLPLPVAADSSIGPALSARAALESSVVAYARLSQRDTWRALETASRALLPAVTWGAVVVALLVAGSRIRETSPTYAAVGEGGLGLTFALKLARRATDRDGDGYSALFGGGDCDDSRADVYPGAEDIPGDGIDQNCEGGDAPLVAEAATETETLPAEGNAAPRPVPSKAGKFTGNILIIAIDATRADRLGVAGYGRPAGRSLTPNLDALAHRGAYFRRVWSQAPNTPRSFPSFVTSRYPSEIAWQKRSLNYSPLLPSNRTFFEPLAGAGMRLIGVFSHFYFTADRGISKGFAEWSDDGAKTIADSNKDVAAPRIVPRVMAPSVSSRSSRISPVPRSTTVTSRSSTMARTRRRAWAAPTLR